MEKNNIKHALSIVGSAVIWAITIIVSALLLKGTEIKGMMLLICTMAVFHFLFMVLMLGVKLRKKDK
jgi:Na+/melibiose symporter-like transporter